MSSRPRPGRVVKSTSPQVNWLLLLAVLGLVLEFRSSSALASAYGFAVTGTMTITTVLATAVMRGVWRWQWPTIAIVLVPIMTVDFALFGSNALKIPSGGWFPLVIGLAVFKIMTTWRTGRRLVLMRLASQAVPLASFLATCERAPEARVSGTAVFLTTQTENVPVTLVHNLKHNKVLHQTVLLIRVVTENIPRVAGADRTKARDLGSGFWQIEAHFGFAQTPNVPRELGRAEIPGLKLDPSHPDTARPFSKHTTKALGENACAQSAVLIMALMVIISASAAAQSPQKWVTSWTGSVQGPIPSATPRLISGGT
jgi:KUP system potassium uptake protein